MTKRKDTNTGMVSHVGMVNSEQRVEYGRLSLNRSQNTFKISKFIALTVVCLMALQGSLVSAETELVAAERSVFNRLAESASIVVKNVAEMAGTRSLAPGEFMASIQNKAAQVAQDIEIFLSEVKEDIVSNKELIQIVIDFLKTELKKTSDSLTHLMGANAATKMAVMSKKLNQAIHQVRVVVDALKHDAQKLKAIFEHNGRVLMASIINEAMNIAQVVGESLISLKDGK